MEQAAKTPPIRVNRLAVHEFRNLERFDLEPGPQFNVIFGDNGSGKSNLLECIYYLGALRSFRGARSQDMVRLGSESAQLHGLIGGRVIAGQTPARRYSVQLRTSAARVLKLDAKRPRSTGQWLSSIHMVLFHPGDLSLSAGAPDGRRSFLDRVLEQVDASYAGWLARYGKALRSRNRLLKLDRADRASIQAYNPLLAEAGAHVAKARAKLIEELAPLVERAFFEVIGDSMPLSIDYRPRVPPEQDAILRALEKSFERDRARGFTAEGPHGDDMAISVSREGSEVHARHHASQGQHRAIVLALKVAEVDVLTRRSGCVPILLLDDVSSELDRSRNRRLFEMLARLGGQVFLTTTHPEFILLDEHRSDFSVERGRINQVT